MSRDSRDCELVSAQAEMDVTIFAGSIACPLMHIRLKKGETLSMKVVPAKESDMPKYFQREAIELVEAGVDPKHQTAFCDDCGHVFSGEEQGVQTCSHTEYLTLCNTCYRKRGNGVR